MNAPTLFRKRIIPAECIELKSDEILRCDKDVLVTRWKALHPKSDLSHGYSCYYLDQGFKVSLFLNHAGKIMYWYCDIVDFRFDKDDEEASPRLTSIDLLADVLIYPDGLIKVVDLDELAEALEKHLIDENTMARALKSLNHLLTIIYRGDFSSLTTPVLDLLTEDPFH